LGSDAEERGDGIQGKMAGDAWAAAEQQLVAFEGRGAVEVDATKLPSVFHGANITNTADSIVPACWKKC